MGREDGFAEHQWWVHVIQASPYYVMPPMRTTAESADEAEAQVIATQMRSRGIFPDDYCIDPERPTTLIR